MAGPPAPVQRVRSGLEQSRHLPPTPPLSPPPSDIEAIKKLVDELVGLADPEKKETARGMGQDLLAAIRKMYDASQSPTGNISLANLRKVVAEEVKAAVNGARAKEPGPKDLGRSAAHRAVPPQLQPNTPTKIVPTCINKEILVRGRGMPADLAKRTPQETIQAVNQVSVRKRAVAARRLPSGDTIVTFQSVGARDWHSTNTNWVKEAFGEQAEESKRTFAVLLKGVWKKNLQGVTEEEFGKETGLRTVDKVKFRVPRHREATPGNGAGRFNLPGGSTQGVPPGRPRRAERLAKETRAEYCWEELSERLKDLARTTREARTGAWRNNLQEASEAKKPDQMWSLERWVRLRSFLPPEPPRLPEFKDSSGQVTAETHDQKASAPTERFFPDPPANLTDVEDQAFLGSWNPGFDVVQAVTPTEMTEAMGRASPWKAPGEDLLPMGLLKACGAPLAEVLALLATRCLELAWFPNRFKRAKTVVLPKPGKAPPAYQTPGGYRPIALLPTLGKVIESVVARKVTQAAEVNGLLPDEQMGNRAHRSTELAVRRVVAQPEREKCTQSASGRRWAYGASSFHIPTDVGGEPVKKGITKALGKAQEQELADCGREPLSLPLIRNLETETWVPPLDSYLNKRLADFENRLQRPDLDDGQGGKKTAASVVLTACRKIQQRLSSRRGNRGRPRTLGPQGPTAVERAAGTVMRWTGGTVDTNRVVEEAWKARWLKERDGRAITRPADDFDHQQETLFRNETLRRHDGLSKAKSSLLIQIRTGAIGLRDFLFTRGVPGVLTPACECGERRETAEHLVVWCLAPPLTRRRERTGIRTRRDFYSVLHGINPTTARLARRVLDWLMDSGKLSMYNLTRRLELEAAA
ncbi:hypothetical protein CHGG_08299 [Chaetomium globosum CBS 148.51]|uniref:Reverse transcriptase domain-containing protein n=1 Tax=Chaetomium globosum (strain ATCC 6205 / CBS 148.51 / DSM 1962 / NBRC 6347 / NRRL 1970) TaxID=306901 RepID=Q2GUQ5_CHAGB|nr:uncharacterized protein CHGG_08299 [Chaetomium globosum CBS 148.51]EAQ87046.1 hypothetical protein CHGG_08299 [Chaetomium globosum CBS 148.51]